MTARPGCHHPRSNLPEPRLRTLSRHLKHAALSTAVGLLAGLASYTLLVAATWDGPPDHCATTAALVAGANRAALTSGRAPVITDAAFRRLAPECFSPIGEVGRKLERLITDP